MSVAPDDEVAVDGYLAFFGIASVYVVEFCHAVAYHISEGFLDA